MQWAFIVDDSASMLYPPLPEWWTHLKNEMGRSSKIDSMCARLGVRFAHGGADDEPPSLSIRCANVGSNFGSRVAGEGEESGTAWLPYSDTFRIVVLGGVPTVPFGSSSALRAYVRTREAGNHDQRTPDAAAHAYGEEGANRSKLRSVAVGTVEPGEKPSVAEKSPRFSAVSFVEGLISSVSGHGS